MFVTWAELRGYAREAGVSFESAWLSSRPASSSPISSTWTTTNETRGRPMDFCEDLDDLVVGLRAGRFCRAARDACAETPSCTQRLTP